MSTFVSTVSTAAVGRWPIILAQLAINIPPKNKHGPCPVCGGHDRFRFDDKAGRGTWFCNQCTPKQAGDGLDLVANVKQWGIKRAAEQVAALLGISQTTGNQDATKRNRCQARNYAMKQQKSENEQKRQKTERARRIWAAGQEPLIADNNPYLQKKNIAAHNVRLSGQPERVGSYTFATGSLLVPRIDTTGELIGLQLIDTQQKRHMGPLADTYHLIGQPGTGDCLWITEGYADAATVYEITNQPVVVAFAADQLANIAKIMHKEYPDCEKRFAADLDPHGKGGIKAREAAQYVDGLVVLPPFEEGQYGDWNDFATQYGADVTREAINTAISNANKNRKTCPTNTNAVESIAVKRLSEGAGPLSTSPKPAFNSPLSSTTIGDWTLTNPETDLQRLKTLNETFSHVTIGGKHMVLSHKPSPIGHNEQVFERLPEFRQYFLHCAPVYLTSPDGGKHKSMSLGEAWLRWQGKAFYPQGVGFYPLPEQCPINVYNLYSGFAVPPIEGDCSVWLNHLRNVVCAGDPDVADYLLKWFAHLIQKPNEKPSVAIVLKSVEGTGKGSLIAPLLAILGPYGIQINGGNQITGRFNSTMANKLLVFADEVDLTDRTIADRLKGIISEPTINLERKGIDPVPIPNHARLIFASNHDQVIRAGLRERRYLVLEPSDQYSQEPGYFQRLWNWINGSGPKHLLHYLQHLSLDGFDPRRCPLTASLVQEKLSGLALIDQFIYEQLCTDMPFGGDKVVTANELVKTYMHWCESHNASPNIAQTRSLIGKRMARLNITARGRSDRGGRFYELPQPDELRARFASMLGSDADDIF